MKISEMPEEAINEWLTKADRKTKDVLVQILFELNAAEQKHPLWPVLKDKDPRQAEHNYTAAAAIVCEESGELIKAALQYEFERGKYYRMHQEAIQTGATAVRFLKNLPEMPVAEYTIERNHPSPVFKH